MRDALVRPDVDCASSSGCNQAAEQCALQALVRPAETLEHNPAGRFSITPGELEQRMRRFLTVAAATVLLGAITTSQSADRRNVWLLNNTGREIQQFRLAVHGTDDPWGNDVLGRETLPNGVGVVVSFNDSRSLCLYDFRLVFDGIHQDYVEGRDICRLLGVQFNKETSIGLQ